MNNTIQFSVMITIAFLSGTLIAGDNATTQTHKSQRDFTAQQRQDKTGTPIAFSQLPSPVQKTLRAEAGNLNIEDVHRISVNGQTAYQASFDKTGMKAKVTVGQDGSLLQYQETDKLELVSEVPKISNTGMKISDLPRAVQKTIKAEAGSNPVGDLSKETESGKTVYHAAFNDQGIHTDLVLDPDGKVLLRSDETALFTAPLQSAQALSLKSAPKAVQDAVRAQGGTSASITDIDKGTWNGQTAYRVMIDKNGSVRPLVIAENGEILGNANGHSSMGSPATSEKSSGASSTSRKTSTSK